MQIDFDIIYFHLVFPSEERKRIGESFIIMCHPKNCFRIVVSALTDVKWSNKYCVINTIKKGLKGDRGTILGFLLPQSHPLDCLRGAGGERGLLKDIES